MMKYLTIACLVSVFWCQTGQAQGPLKNKIRDAARKANKETSDSSEDKRNDFEGVIWEFKVIDRKEKDKTKQTKLTGLLRVKESAIFAMGDVEKGSEKAGDKKKEDADVRGRLKEIMSKRLKNAEGKSSGGERVGDMSKNGAKEYILKFDEDDDYPLSGRAELKPDTKNKGGIWFGKYVEYLEGSKKKSWRMELRKIDE